MTKVFSLLEFIAFEIPAIERDLHASGPKIIEACLPDRAKEGQGRDRKKS